MISEEGLAGPSVQCISPLETQDYQPWTAEAQELGPSSPKQLPCPPITMHLQDALSAR